MRREEKTSTLHYVSLEKDSRFKDSIEVRNFSRVSFKSNAMIRLRERENKWTSDKMYITIIVICIIVNRLFTAANVNILNRDTGRNRVPFLPFGYDIYIRKKSRKHLAKFFQIYDTFQANSSPSRIEFAAKGCRNFRISE